MDPFQVKDSRLLDDCLMFWKRMYFSASRKAVSSFIQ